MVLAAWAELMEQLIVVAPEVVQDAATPQKQTRMQENGETDGGSSSRYGSVSGCGLRLCGGWYWRAAHSQTFHSPAMAVSDNLLTTLHVRTCRRQARCCDWSNEFHPSRQRVCEVGWAGRCLRASVRSVAGWRRMIHAAATDMTSTHTHT